MFFEDWATLFVIFIVYWWAQSGEGHRPEKDKNATKFYQSAPWRRLRKKTLGENKSFFGRHGPTCERCGSHPGQLWRRALIAFGLMSPNKMKWEVDHIKARSTHHRLRLEYKNTQVLCKFCNLQKSNGPGLDWKGIRRWGLGLICPPLSLIVTLIRS